MTDTGSIDAPYDGPAVAGGRDANTARLLHGALISDLERVLIDHESADDNLASSLNAAIADARYHQDDLFVDALDNARFLLARLPGVSESDVLPVLFALQDMVRPTEYELDGDELSDANSGHGSALGGQSAEGASEMVIPAYAGIAVDQGDDLTRLLQLDPIRRRALRRRLRLGERAWLISIEGAIDAAGLTRLLERSYSVIASQSLTLAPDVVRLAALTVDVNAPTITIGDLGELLDPETSELSVSAVDPGGVEATMGGEEPGIEGPSGTGNVAGAAVLGRTCDVSVSEHDLELLHFFAWIQEHQQPSLSPVAVQLRERLAASLSVSIRGVVDSVRGRFESAAAQHGKRVVVRVVTDVASVDALTADTIREIVAEYVVNAIVHGIETPSERQKLGKRETGRVTVSVSTTDEGYSVRVSDDGRGVDQDAVRQSGRRGGESGLSRVRTLAVHQLGGHVSLRSGASGATALLQIPGHGIRLRAVVFESRGTKWALPVAIVSKEIADVRAHIVVDGTGWFFVRHEGHLIRLLSPVATEPPAGRTALVIVLADVAFGLAVDRVDRVTVAVAAGPSKMVVPAIEGLEVLVPDVDALVAAVRLAPVRAVSEARDHFAEDAEPVVDLADSERETSVAPSSEPDPGELEEIDEVEEVEELSDVEEVEEIEEVEELSDVEEVEEIEEVEELSDVEEIDESDVRPDTP